MSELAWNLERQALLQVRQVIARNVAELVQRRIGVGAEVHIDMPMLDFEQDAEQISKELQPILDRSQTRVDISLGVKARVGCGHGGGAAATRAGRQPQEAAAADAGPRSAAETAPAPRGHYGQRPQWTDLPQSGEGSRPEWPQPALGRRHHLRAPARALRLCRRHSRCLVTACRRLRHRPVDRYPAHAGGAQRPPSIAERRRPAASTTPIVARAAVPYRELLAAHGFIGSMGRRGNPRRVVEARLFDNLQG
jgi:hypothetical protein